MLLLGNQTSTFAQQAPPQQELSFNNNSGLVPVVPPPKRVFDAVSLKGTKFNVDGLVCHKCKLSNVTISYGGGAYSIEEGSISLPIRIELTGAALNTAGFLNSFGLLGCPANKPTPEQPTVPQIMTAKYVVGNRGENSFISLVSAGK